jgi:outer membrane protein assembly factor BamB
MRTRFGFLAAALIVAVPWQRASAQDPSVLTYHGDPARSGNYVVPGLTWDRAAALYLDTTFAGQVTGHVYAQPLYWHPPGAKRGRLLVATESDVVQALDAESGALIWTRTVGTPVPGSSLRCGNIDPLGITGTPVIDPRTQTIYFDAMLQGENGTPRHRVFAVSLTDGSIVPGWPVDVADALRLAGKVFYPDLQNQRGALTIIGDVLYVSYGGLDGDCGDYHGWVVGFPLDGPHNYVASFETQAQGGGIWGPGGVSVIDNEIFFTTGNTFGANTWSDGEAVFGVKPNLSRLPGQWEYFTPSDWKTLDDDDLDLGGSNVVPVNAPTAGGYQELIVALGKDGKAYVLDRHKLGGIGGQLVVDTVSLQPIRTAAAVYPSGDSASVAFQAPGTQCPKPDAQNDLTVLKITAGSPPSMSTAWCGALSGAGSAMATTTDGHSNPIVWIVGAEGDNELHAFRGDTGTPIVTSPAMQGLRHFETLIATEDHLYVGSDGRIYAFSF